MNMVGQLKVPAVTAVQKPIQSAAMHLRAPGLDAADSGIDSDEPLPYHSSPDISEYSTDDEEAERELQNKEATLFNDPVFDALEYIFNPEPHGPNRAPVASTSASPPLYEVELTASEEDEDASVLELAIPMQARYKRVPTSSPKKTKPKKKSTFFSRLFCCVRKQED